MNEKIIQTLVHKRKKRLGRGHGSGKVKTSGRGTKGQNARGKVHFGFEGGQLPLTRRLPFLRGKSKNKSIQKKSRVIEVSKLQIFSKNADVTQHTLKEKGLLKKDESAKILAGKIPLAVPLCVSVPVSKSARKIIEAAGGTVVLEK
ncbi:MAG: 50S ribosomal protein L15 [Candidatus Gottesmanbacteria bacterium GW2011_GWA2_44_17]|uniref:Large ribosomal subunit protein uL15 n=3 Tax=Candidatus Gottesmaniibacteriota TaxID=1752720 RepID=A0A0G1IQE7_9BACT|nr:MAG: 50S ribosomal protein L15 [Microgenomates group bacterium GW2011_GWC1_43_11]KKT38668.1 MAG: 50S ribosomal protein L15 [Candidatus Gottesmanbacteria bacterium GW2011_GWB1_44_11c]KKT47362.1 MAG: 50S ribosomal protein L15 [Candidatus Gottesmanbacteria bacterium GW2011_GWA2_44_17]KKT61163.1 MAG: 50S ribosomal protein L15 [Candidatus Gottesmanbacteria bacterium GW2011_GWA1_44_24b]HCM82424.1 50S ribosomal protein L15 [Patescibacteria group bacterium]